MTKAALTLKAVGREATGKKVNELRKQGKLPAVLYGHKIKPTNLSINQADFEKLYRQTGDNTLIDLVVDDAKPVKVLVQDHQIDPVSSSFIHIDLHQVDMDEKIHTDIPLKFIGEAPAVKTFAGILITNMDALSVECLPGDLIHEIEVDLSSLKTFDDILHVSDLKVPSTITIKSKLDEVIAQVQAPAEEEVFTAAPTAVVDVPVVGKEEKAAEGEGAEAADKKE